MADIDQTALRTLHAAVATMDLPVQRKSAMQRHDLAWLGRNMAVRNVGHPRFDEAVLALRVLDVPLILD